jgi:hypothetical protein
MTHFCESEALDLRTSFADAEKALRCAIEAILVEANMIDMMER